MHFGVALGWSALFGILVAQFAWLRRTLSAPGGPFRVAVVYGPLIWMTMSLLIIPRLTGRPQCGMVQFGPGEHAAELPSAQSVHDFEVVDAHLGLAVGMACG